MAGKAFNYTINNLVLKQLLYIDSMAWKDEKQTPGHLLSLHRMMTEGALDNPERVGNWRKESDNVCVE